MSLSVVSKQQLWAAEAGLPPDLPRPPVWHLKSIQDAVAFDLIGDATGKRIVDIGGGDSRLLPWLSKQNDCVLADPLDGSGGGPKRLPETPSYEVVREAVGPNQDLLRHIEPFDIAFSVSVVEHVPTEELDGFFDACRLIIRPAGRMIHLIDCYLTTDAPNRILKDRIAGYVSPLRRGFKANDPSATIQPRRLRFEAWMATNPDNMMSRWNQSVPELRPVRETHQSITLLMDYVAAEAP